MPAKSSDRKLCFINGCPYNRKARGVCGQHYYEWRTQGLWEREMALFEIEGTYQPPKMGPYAYRRRLQTFALSLPVSDKQRRKFIKAMFADYRGVER